jgi:carboxyl-terminal processing protease
MLRGEPGTVVKVRVRRKNVPNEMNLSITREIIRIAQIEGDLITFNGTVYAYIKNKMFSQNNAQELEAKYAELSKKSGNKLSGLILSLENNPGGLLDEAWNNIRLFVETKKDIILIRSNDGISPHAPALPERILHEKPKDITGGLPILVVVNGGSASASEVLSRSLQHHRRALVAGTSTTFGKGIVQTAAPGPGGSAIKYTSSEYLIGSVDDWVSVQCSGVTPDVLFEYSGVKKVESMKECELNGFVDTLGPMKNSPHRPLLKDANPVRYQAGLQMLEAYKQYMLPKLQKQEEQRKALEQQGVQP